MKGIFIAIILLISKVMFCQISPETEGQKDWSKPTTFGELSVCVGQLDDASDLLTTEVIGTSAEGRNLFALYFSSTEFGSDTGKIKVLIFAQQHGNEQSGKEGALLLAKELLKPEYQYLFNSIDLVLIPQMNPDGSEVNQRRNGNDMDLNRNHLILTEPETMALHKLFDKHLFEVTMDVHEYSPYSEEWLSKGIHKNSDEMIGTTTNIDVPDSIRNISKNDFVPFYKKYLNDKGYSAFEYCPGGPPETDYIRLSTFDINDGRQSLGILGTFSFIQEGKNGKDDYCENLERRANGQMSGMLCLLEFVSQNKSRIKQIIDKEREKLIGGDEGQRIAIQSVHSADGSKLDLPVYVIASGNDSIIRVHDFRPIVKSLTDVRKPKGYLVPKELEIIIDWAQRHDLLMHEYHGNSLEEIEQYRILRIDSIDFELDTIVDPVVESEKIRIRNPWQYMFIPTAQLKGNMIVLALEPKSMLGLATYLQFASLLKPGETFPVLRVVTKERDH
jgi:hypothetical protein